MSIIRRLTRWIKTSFEKLVDWMVKPLDIPPIKPISENGELKEFAPTEEELKKIRERVRKLDILEATIITTLIMVFLAIVIHFIMQ